MKNCIFILLAMLSFGLATGQNDSDYNKLIKKNWNQIENYMEKQQALSEAGASYIQTIDNILASEKVSIEVADVKETKARMRQYNWMTKFVPVYVSSVNNQKDINNRIDASIGNFVSTFGLTGDYSNSIRKSLSQYVSAYESYLSMYYQLNDVLSFGLETPPTPPVPPQIHQIHQIHQQSH